MRYMLAPHIATPPAVTPDSRDSGVIRGPWMGLAPSGGMDPGSKAGVTVECVVSARGSTSAAQLVSSTVSQ